jgi:uncharacterized membrane protein SpoIIM required for sporulation
MTDFVWLAKTIVLFLAVGFSASYIFAYFAYGNKPKPKRKGPPEFENEFDDDDNDSELIEQHVGNVDDLNNGE